jgi:hypothetical protein
VLPTLVYEDKALRYADGKFDVSFNRVIVIIIQEGKLYCDSCRLIGA